MKDYKDFINDLGYRESKNRYDVVNPYGFLGRWQFGKPRLYDAGLSIDNYSPKGMNKRRLYGKKHFLANRDNIQDKIMHWHVYNLADSLNKKYSGYYGTFIDGIEITLSGLVAGAHLLGPGGVKQFLKGENGTDANGTKISEYISKFGGYELYPPEIDLKNEIAKIDALAIPKPMIDNPLNELT